MFIETKNIGFTRQFMALNQGMLAYKEGRISKQKLNSLYEAVINDAFTFFQKGTTAVIAMPKVTRKHGVFLRRSA
jgi:hypothetical protein